MFLISLWSRKIGIIIVKDKCIKVNYMYNYYLWKQQFSGTSLISHTPMFLSIELMLKMLSMIPFVPLFCTLYKPHIM